MWSVNRISYVVCLVSTLLYCPAGVHGQQAGSLQMATEKQLYREAVHLLGGGRNPVKRWYEDINIALVNDSAHTLLPIVVTILTEASLLTGIRFRIINHRINDGPGYLSEIKATPPYDVSICDSESQHLCANFLVIVTSQNIMHEIAKALPMRPVFRKATQQGQQVPCFFSPGYSKNQQIKKEYCFCK